VRSQNDGKMRKAIGILMIIIAVMVFLIVRAAYIEPSEGMIPYEGLAKWLSTFMAIFLLAGGVYLLRRK